MHTAAEPRDPTLEGAQQMEIQERGCAVCERRRVLSTGELRCGVGKRFPFCRADKKKGFRLDVGCDGE